MSVIIQLRRDTAANWTTVNPVLRDGELGIEHDTDKAKLGDGSTAWNSLAYWQPTGADTDNYDPAGTAATAVAAEQARAQAAEALLAPLGTDGHIASGVAARPTLYAPRGLRRWRAALGDVLFSQIPIVCVGDSITAGQGGDNNVVTFSNVPDNSQGWVGQLRALLAIRNGSYPGEGFIFADDSRVTNNGTASNNWPCVPLRHGPRMLHGDGHSLSLTIPSGITSLGIIQANQTAAFNSAGTNLADVSALYSQTGSATVTNASITTLTNTGRAIETFIAVQPGDVITVSSPATAQSYIVGFDLRTANPGVVVHRVGQSGYVSGDMLGGQSSGTLLQSGSPTNQTTAIRACYDWAGTQGLIIVAFGTNDQGFQSGGGSVNQNNVTLSLYTTWMTQFIAQAVSDGWAVLMFAPGRNPSAPSSPSTQDQYFQAIQSYALANDHVSYLDTGELWGSTSASLALGLTTAGSVHPLRKGHGDMARMAFNAITATAGITEITAA